MAQGRGDKQLIRLIWQGLLGGRRTSLSTKCKRLFYIFILGIIGVIGIYIYESVNKSYNVAQPKQEINQQKLS